MGKKRNGLKQAKKSGENFADFEDEIDVFHKQRDKVILGDEDNESENESGEELQPMYDLGIESDEEEEEEEEENEEEGGGEEQNGSLEDEDEDNEEEEDDQDDTTWGRKKKAFYDADFHEGENEEDEEAAALEEEKEARRLQEKKSKSMKSVDFDEDELVHKSLESRIQSTGESKKKQKSSKDSDSAILEDMNKELDNVSLDIQADEVSIETVPKNIDKLSKKEKLEIIMSESPELLELLEEFKSKISDVSQNVHPLLEKAKSGNLCTKKGISYLEVKFHLLLSYCINICFYLLLKAEGKSVKDHPVIVQLVRIRTILEKIRPLDQKLKYQIDKLLKIAATGKSEMATDDPRRFKPNPDALVHDEEEKEEHESGIYKPPRLAEMHFDDKSGQMKKLERAKKRFVNSEMMKEIVREFSDKPETDTSTAGISKNRVDLEELRQEQYEEDNFIRLQLSKKNKKQTQKNQLQDEIDQLADFADIAAFNSEDQTDIANAESDAQKFLEKSRKSVKQIIRNLGQEKDNKRKSGDLDLPYPDPDAESSFSKKRKKQQDQLSFGQDEDEGLSNNFDDEDEFYKNAKKLSQAKKQKKDAGNQRYSYAKEQTLEEGEKRGIGRRIESNRGLTRARPKDSKNPKKKFRMKYEKAQSKLRGMRRKMRSQDQPYGGEATGIKANITRSRKF